MKLIYVFLISGAIALTAGFYMLLDDKASHDAVRNSRAQLSVYEKPINQGRVTENAVNDDKGKNITALSDEVSQLRADVLALRADLKKSSQKTPTQGLPKDLETIHEMHAKEDDPTKNLEVLEAGFQQQTTDPVWSEKTKNLVQDGLFKDNLTAEDIIDVDCRNSMCRVELANNKDSDGLRLEELPMKIGAELPNIVANQIKEKDGSTSTVLYLSRDTLILPKAENK
jgi:hypothetical protein